MLFSSGVYRQRLQFVVGVPPDDAALLQEGTAFFPGSSLAGNGLLVSDGELWKRQRQLSNPAFRRAAVESYTDVRCMSISSHAKMA